MTNPQMPLRASRSRFRPPVGGAIVGKGSKEGMVFQSHEVKNESRIGMLKADNGQQNNYPTVVKKGEKGCRYYVILQSCDGLRVAAALKRRSGVKGCLH